MTVEEWLERYRRATEDRGDITLPGCLPLRFARDGRCEELGSTGIWIRAARASAGLGRVRQEPA